MKPIISRKRTENRYKNKNRTNNQRRVAPKQTDLVLRMLTNFLKNKRSRFKTTLPNKPGRPDAIMTRTKGESYDYVQRLNHLQKLQYYHALIHPYAVCIERSPVSMPMDLPLPTVTTYNLKRFDINTDASGNLRLRFHVPKFYSYNSVTPGQVYYTYGDPTVSTAWSRIINAPIVQGHKARNIGCELRLLYTGKMFDTAGTIESMASYSTNGLLYSAAPVPATCTTQEFPTTPDILAYAHQMPWYEKKPITPGCLTRCVWAPADFSDKDFHTAQAYAASTYKDDVTSDMEWFLVIKGAQASATFTIELANIIEVQPFASGDVYPRNSSSLTSADIHNPEVIKEALTNRNAEYHSGTNVADALKGLAVKGIGYVGDHLLDIGKWGLTALGSLFV